MIRNYRRGSDAILRDLHSIMDDLIKERDTARDKHEMGKMEKFNRAINHIADAREELMKPNVTKR